jgi:hypothetical protein
MAHMLDRDEIIKRGSLYKHIPDKSAWEDTIVALCGLYLYQYSKNNVFRGRFNISNCSLLIIKSSKEKKGVLPRGKFGLLVENIDDNSICILFCTSSEKDLSSWFTAITDQVRVRVTVRVRVSY